MSETSFRLWTVSLKDFQSYINGLGGLVADGADISQLALANVVKSGLGLVKQVVHAVHVQSGLVGGQSGVGPLLGGPEEQQVLEYLLVLAVVGHNPVFQLVR